MLNSFVWNRSLQNDKGLMMMPIADSHFLLANARLVDFPVVYCSEGLCQLTGFERSELMQKPAVCSTMHGEQTTTESIERFQDAMEKQISDQFEIQLYRKNSNVSFYCVHPVVLRDDQSSMSSVSLFNCIHAYINWNTCDMMRNSGLNNRMSVIDS